MTVIDQIRDQAEGSVIVKIEEVGDTWVLQLPHGELTFAATLTMEMGPGAGFSGRTTSRIYWTAKKEDKDGAGQQGGQGDSDRP